MNNQKDTRRRTGIDRDRWIDTDRQIQTDRDRQREREERVCDVCCVKDRERRETERERGEGGERETDRQIQTDRDRQTD